MSEDIAQLRAKLVARMQELGVGANDPRLVPMVSQLRALMQQHATTMLAAGAGRAFFSPATDDGKVELSANLSANLPLPLQETVRDYVRTVRANTFGTFAQAPALSETEPGRRLLELAAADKAVLAVEAYLAWSSERHGGRDASALRRIVSDLLRGKITLEDGLAIKLVQAAVQNGFAYTSYTPNQAVLSVLKRHVAACGLSAGLRQGLIGLRTKLSAAVRLAGTEGRKLLMAVEALLEEAESKAGGEPRFRPKPDAWSSAVETKLVALAMDVRSAVTELLALAAKGGANAKPTKTWLKTAEIMLNNSALCEVVGEQLLEIIECYEPGDPDLAPENQNTLRALLWLTALANPQHAVRRLEAYAQKSLTFSPVHLSYRSLVLGNAAIHAFALMPGTTGVGGLSRLRRRLKRPGEVKTIDKALGALASQLRMSSGELEEIGLPQYGFAVDGTLRISVGPAVARLTITENSALETSWSDADGRPLAGVPAAVKDDHSDALKALKAQTKEIGETLKAQRLRLERLYLDDRAWPLEIWQARYLNEPLVADLARRLIWLFERQGRWVAGLVEGGGVFDAGGSRVELEGGSTRVKLWHPMQSDAGHVLAWRRRLASLGITQPFKQVHREIYILTDAERATHSYSNRFAGHVVEQHRFRALCQARGWKCPTFGAWDPGAGRPLKRIEERKLQVEFWVDPVEATMQNDIYQFQYLTTDQVRFVGADGDAVALANVDGVLFSELMRDADLFVGVAGIGSDPTWGDRQDERFGEYWGRAAFGALSETGKTRRAVLEDLLPGLTIAGRCRLEDRYLVVDGKLRTYRIHLGSGNIQMEPNSQYLCIVQDRGRGREVRLPFEGDATLSAIISKAFLLVDDATIKDKSIRSQILRNWT